MIRFIVIITALFILQDCTTILNCSKKQLSITSSEDGSKVTAIYEVNKITGKNLVVIKAKKGTVTAIGEKKGCETVSRNIESSGDWGWLCQSGSNEKRNKSVNVAGALDFIGFSFLI